MLHQPGFWGRLLVVLTVLLMGLCVFGLFPVLRFSITEYLIFLSILLAAINGLWRFVKSRTSENCGADPGRLEAPLTDATRPSDHTSRADSEQHR